MDQEYKSILAAVDSSEESFQALKKGFELAKENDAKLIISHVVDTRITSSLEQYDDAAFLRAKKYGEELLENYKEKAINSGINNVETVLEYGTPKVKIPTEIARKHEADVIIVGATGINAAQRIFLGSVSENIARRADCDVLIVRKSTD
ncbi:universal stress protein [Bacillus sp. FJAT-44742]|uniref:universal stress protein n=1 Tax=Bacillus sp. FJAT-44742 TaxID=2014005 RepID=UPI000C23AEB4|nr:universal stress protein [Bacillus sp. FJAT-44742]